MPAYDEQEYTKSFDIKIWKRLGPYLRPRRRAFVLLIVLNLLTALVDAALPLFQRYAVAHFIEAGTLERPLALRHRLLCRDSDAVALGHGLRQRLDGHRDVPRPRPQAQALHAFAGALLLLLQRHARRLPHQPRDERHEPHRGHARLEPRRICSGRCATSSSCSYRCCCSTGSSPSSVILVVPVVALLTAYFQNRILHWNRRVRKLSSRITGAFNEGIMGAKTSKTLVIEDANDTEFEDLTGQARDSGVKAAKLSAVYIPLVLFCSTLAVAIVLVSGRAHEPRRGAGPEHALGLRHLRRGHLRAGADTCRGPCGCSYRSRRTSSASPACSTPSPMCATAEAVREKYGDAFHPKRENWEPIVGDIEFRDVTFRYPDGGEDVLSHFNLHIPAGTTVAIVGETGAGKSTLVNLACRFFEPTEGQILIDGVDYRERSQLWLHSSLGYVLQSPHLFSGSLRENIRYGRLDATDAEVEIAAKAVSADVVAERLENGWDSDVGEGGDRLSTGEKQLVSFARAVLADPRIFVLDEATSSIDTQTEQLIQDAIEHILKDRT